MFNPELDGQGKVEPLKQHRKALLEQKPAPKNNSVAAALRKAMAAKVPPPQTAGE